jgi:hypothetical protein
MCYENNYYFCAIIHDGSNETELETWNHDLPAACDTG